MPEHRSAVAAPAPWIGSRSRIGAAFGGLSEKAGKRATLSPALLTDQTGKSGFGALGHGDASSTKGRNSDSLRCCPCGPLLDPVNNPLSLAALPDRLLLRGTAGEPFGARPQARKSVVEGKRGPVR